MQSGKEDKLVHIHAQPMNERTLDKVDSIFKTGVQYRCDVHGWNGCPNIVCESRHAVWYCSQGKHFCTLPNFVNSNNTCNKCWYACLVRKCPETVLDMQFQRTSPGRSVWLEIKDNQPTVTKRIVKHGLHELNMHCVAQKYSVGILPLIDYSVNSDEVVLRFPYVHRLRFSELCSFRRYPNYFRSLCIVLRNLHAKGFAHGDVKPDNILISRHSGKLFLADFGLSTSGVRNMEGSARTTVRGAGGTAGFRAPEVLSGVSYVSAAADMWAVGITLLSFLRRRLPGPFCDKEEELKFVHRVLYETQSDARSLVGGRRGSIAAIQLLKGLLCEKPAKRLTAERCLEHPFLNLHGWS